MTKYALPFALLLSSVISFATTSKQVSYKSGDETVQGLLYTPDGKGPFPAIIVIHEWWGLNDWVRQQAQKLADLGYESLAIDLYRGKSATTPDEAHQLMRGVPSDRAQRDLQAAFAFLSSQPDVEKDHVGSIGWCMGGGYALDLALSERKLRSAVMNYGRISTDTASLQKMNAAILGIFGAQDKGIPVEAVEKFGQTLKQMGKKVEIVVYPDAGHAFENPNNKDGYRPKDAAEAWERTQKFLDQTLRH